VIFGRKKDQKNRSYSLNIKKYINTRIIIDYTYFVEVGDLTLKDDELNMEVHQISFAKVCILSTNCAEITVNSGVDINLEMVDEIHHFLLSQFNYSFSLLINKTNAYSTQLDALIQFGTLTAIDKIAIFAPNKLAKMSADFSASIPSSSELNIDVFTERDDALDWISLK